MTPLPPRTTPPAPTFRLIPSRFPPVSAFDDVASAADLAAAMELEGWTNDRLAGERLARLPQDQWAYGQPNASVIMAAFLHAAPMGQRFSCPDLGAWYGAYALPTAVAEVAHHLRRETINADLPEMRGCYRVYLADLIGTEYVDLRGLRGAQPDLYACGDYRASQAYGEAARAAGVDGLTYDSLRQRGGHNVVCYRPRAITNVRQSDHYEIAVRPTGPTLARKLSAATAD